MFRQCLSRDIVLGKFGILCTSLNTSQWWHMMMTTSCCGDALVWNNTKKGKFNSKILQRKERLYIVATHIIQISRKSWKRGSLVATNLKRSLTKDRFSKAVSWPPWWAAETIFYINMSQMTPSFIGKHC